MGIAGPSPGASTEPPHSPLLVPGETSGQLANKYSNFLTVSSNFFFKVNSHPAAQAHKNHTEPFVLGSSLPLFPI